MQNGYSSKAEGYEFQLKPKEASKCPKSMGMKPFTKIGVSYNQAPLGKAVQM